MTNAKILKPLRTLPTSNIKYRVNAFGNVHRNPSCNSNHLLDIFLYPVSDNIHQYYNLAPSQLGNQQERRQISIGEFFAFSSGTILSRGRVIWRPAKPNLTVSIDVNPQTIRIIRADHHVEENSFRKYLVSPSQFRFGSALGTNLIAVQLGCDPYAILIPMMELIRYFYAGSSRLVQALFSADITDLSRFINQERSVYNEKDRELFLVLRRQYKDCDACLLGLWWTSAYAHRNAMKVWEATLPLRRESDAFYSPKALFPFLGRCGLSAFGTYIDGPSKSNKRFLVQTILSADFKLPFDKIVFEREEDNFNTSFDEHRKKDGHNSITYRRRPRPRFPECESYGKNDPFSNPSGFVDVQNIEIEANRFQSVKVKKRIEIQLVKYAGDSINELQTPSNQSTSTPTFGKTTSRPISINPVSSKPQILPPTQSSSLVPADFSKFQEICSRLGLYKNVKSIINIAVNRLSAESHISQFYLPINFKTTANSWNTVGNRPRQLMLKAVTIENDARELYFYLIEIEKDPSKSSEAYAIYIFYNSNCTRLSESVLSELVDILGKVRFKRYSRYFSECGFRIIRKNHAGNIFQMLSRMIRILEDISSNPAKTNNVSLKSSIQVEAVTRIVKPNNFLYSSRKI